MGSGALMSCIKMEKIIRHWGVPCLVIFGLLFSRLALPQVAPSAEQILDYHSDIRVQEDASLLVRETIRVRSAGQGRQLDSCSTIARTKLTGTL
jgi:hypothetical protein